MKVLHVNVTLDPASGGGTAERTVQIAKFLKKAGADCAVLTLDTGLDSRRRDALPDVPVTALPCMMARYHAFRLPEPRIMELVRWCDAIHLVSHWTLLNAVVYRAARRTGRPYLVCPAGALPIYGRSRPLKRLYNGFIGHRIIRNAARCIAIARNEIDAFRSYGAADERIALIPNGVDPAQFGAADPRAFCRKFGLDAHSFVLFMGRLNAIKGPDLLLQAFCRISGVFQQLHLVFAGPDGGMLAALRAMAAAAGVADRVHFIGFIAGADKAGAYRAARLLAIPSRQEAMSIVVLEAGACATPVLITNRCGFDEAGEIGGGRVVDAAVEALSSALREMLSDDAELHAMGQRLRAHVLRNFDWRAAARKYMEELDRVVRSPR